MRRSSPALRLCALALLASFFWIVNVAPTFQPVIGSATADGATITVAAKAGGIWLAADTRGVAKQALKPPLAGLPPQQEDVFHPSLQKSRSDFSGDNLCGRYASAYQARAPPSLLI
ncbi:hypothetical protein JYU29_05555 [Tianweitania sp. BSSL-BM11]|uniref:Uncharacterized protein n=1 Tax=Tianweitania aestuarii TaxID=2814886 RepID=A0ABS5RV42_9HYPH|nr:hypothetical protein [Tianweitania aestuarii]MBS9720151.1 hypothetical protein [Tianweitania aestuarii]